MAKKRKSPNEDPHSFRISLSEVMREVRENYGGGLRALQRYTVNLLNEKEIPEVTGWNEKDFRRLIRERGLGPFINDLMGIAERRLRVLIIEGDDSDGILYANRRIQVLKHLRDWYFEEFA
jgi:hypothetical protein